MAGKEESCGPCTPPPRVPVSCWGKKPFGIMIDGDDVEGDGEKENGEGENGIIEDPVERVAVNGKDALEDAFGGHVEAAMRAGMLVAQQVGAHHGRGGEGDDHGDEDGGGERDGEFAEEAADDAAHEKQRDEDGDEGDADGQNGEADFFGAL